MSPAAQGSEQLLSGKPASAAGSERALSAKNGSAHLAADKAKENSFVTATGLSQFFARQNMVLYGIFLSIQSYNCTIIEHLVRACVRACVRVCVLACVLGHYVW